MIQNQAGLEAIAESLKTLFKANNAFRDNTQWHDTEIYPALQNFTSQVTHNQPSKDQICR